jgi:hypothetical protein
MIFPQRINAYDYYDNNGYCGVIVFVLYLQFMLLLRAGCHFYGTFRTIAKSSASATPSEI